MSEEKRKKRVGLGYLVSAVAPLVALAVLMLRAFHPHTRLLAVLIYLAGWGMLMLALWEHQRARRALTTLKGHARFAAEALSLARRRFRISLGVFLTALVAFPLLLPTVNLDYFRADLDLVTAQTQRDEEGLQLVGKQLPRSLVDLRRALASLKLEDASSRERLRSAWAGYVDHAVLLDQMVTRQQHFYQLAPRDVALADRAFLVGYRALLQQMQAGHRVVSLVRGKSEKEALLNEASPVHGLPGNTYSRLERAATSPRNLLRLEAGLGHLRVLSSLGRLEGREDDVDAARKSAKRALLLLGADPGALVEGGFERLETTSFEAWFPLQKGAAQLISPLRLKNRESLISPAQLEQLRSELQPGDILVQRRNWYLTNLGIPGFWPHAALYVGRLSELDAAFPASARALIDGVAPSAYLLSHYPKAHAALSQRESEGQAPAVLEAIGEGVVVRSLEHSGHADYMGALRPRLSDEVRLVHVLEAFRYLGRPYDYNFEFSTDASLVCSELVYKALAPRRDLPGVRFPLVTQNGRFVLPPNDIVRSFDETWGKPTQQLDFVAFLDGNEADGRASRQSEQEFRSTWKRPKWDIAQE